MDFGSDFPYFEEGTQENITITLLENAADTGSNVTNTASVMALDPYNVSAIPVRNNVIDQFGNNVLDDFGVQVAVDGIALSFKNEGTGIVKAVYNFNGEWLVDEYEFVVYKNFFRANYKNHLIPKFEKNILDSNPARAVFFDTIMEYFDIAWAYRKDIEQNADPLFAKSKFLDNLGQSRGFQRIDYEREGTDLEEIAESTYRELLRNLVDLIEIAGTPLSYQLFFSALGFDIELQEFWWDADSNLIEVNTDDPSQSTFFAYNSDGAPLDDPQVSRDDPRRFVSPSNPYNVNNKSNYVRPVISAKSGLSGTVGDPANFDSVTRRIIDSYLDFLRPQHVQYLTEVLVILLAEENIDILSSFGEDFLTYILIVLTQPGKVVPTAGVPDPDSEITPNPDPGFTPAPAEGIDYDQGFGIGVFPVSNPTGAFCEDLWSLFFTQNDSIIIGGILDDLISDQLGYIVRWDAPDFIFDEGTRWDEARYFRDEIAITQL